MGIYLEKDDDEISIDFGKVKNFFKKKDATDSRDTSSDSSQATHKENHKHKSHRIDQDNEPEGKLVDVEKSGISDDKSPEDDISIDFSKVKKFFKSKPAEQPPKDIKEDDEISFDFSKVKNIFKKPSQQKSDDEVSVDWKKVWSTVLKYQVVLLVLIPIILSFHYRMIPADIPVTDDWARSSVSNYVRQQITQEVAGQYPNLPDENRAQLVESEYQKVLEQEKDQIAQQITATSQYFKQQLQDDDGHMHLPDIDTYYWMRHARNVLLRGYPGDKIVNGIKMDDHMIAPLGRYLPNDMFHAYLMAYSYRFFNFFDSDFELNRVCFFFPVIVSVLSVIPAFFIARRFGGNLAGFVAGGIVALHPAFLVRTAAGVCDTDAYNVFFPLMITWLFLEAFESHNWKKMTMLSVGSGFLVGLYSFTWGGWWFIMDFVFAGSGLYVAYYAFVHRHVLKTDLRKFVSNPQLRDPLVTILIFAFSCLIFVCVIQSYGVFSSGLFHGPSWFSQIKDVGVAKVWPNVFTTVAEQNEVSFAGIINNAGGNLLFAIGIFGILIAAFSKSKKGEYDPKLAILLAIWFVATLYASTKGVRWVLLFIPALSIAVGIAAGLVYRKVSHYVTDEFGVNKILTRVMVIAVILLLLFFFPKNMVSAAKNTARQEIPLINDAWVASLEAINQNASENAIVNSWWDYGHWFKYIADRPVTFDGTSQDTPMAHWIGKVLLTDDEDLAIGILRMLDCGSHKAFDELDKVIEK
ncbi:MAG: STT3 domain-containing protein, partial [Candidatus Woesearchaeota archaeon]